MFYEGSLRKYQFWVGYSNSPNGFYETAILDLTSSPLAEGFFRYYFISAVNARYIRIGFDGNSACDIGCSITRIDEVRIWMIGSVVTPTTIPSQQLGDVNSSGAVDIVDALLVAQYYVGLKPTNFNTAVADVNCSGNIDIVDALLIAQLYVGLIQVLPCGSVTNPPAATPNSGPTDPPQAPPGGAWLRPASLTVYVNQNFTQDIYINAGDQKVANYDVTVTYGSNVLRVNTDLGVSGVSQGTYGFIGNVDAGTPGKLRITGSNPAGTGPGVNLFFLQINWTSLTLEGATSIGLITNVLSDTNGNTIGTLQNVGATVIVIAAGTPTPAYTPTPTIEPTPDVTPEPTPDPTAVTLKAMYQCGDTNSASIKFEPHVKIGNTGVEDIPLEAITFRYFYTKEGDSEEVATVLSSGAIPANVITTFHQDYLEVGFVPGSGVLHPQNGNEGGVCLEVHKLDWSGYDQTNDWSFDPTKTEFTDWEHITVYYDGVLKWGSTPPPTPAPPFVFIKPDVNTVWNEGSAAEIRWQTADGTQSPIKFYLHKQSDFVNQSDIQLAVTSTTSSSSGFISTITVPGTIVPGTDYSVKANIVIMFPIFGTEFTITIAESSKFKIYDKLIASPPAPTPEASQVSLKLKYLCLQPSVTDVHSIIARFYIENTNTIDVPLQSIKLRYYYTKEYEINETALLDYSGGGSTTKSFQPGYIEIGFGQDTGVIGANGGKSGELAIELKKFDGGFYDQSDDWSFDGTMSVYTYWSHVPLYYTYYNISGTIPWFHIEINTSRVWGIEPTTPEPTPDPTAEPTPSPTPDPSAVTLKAMYRCGQPEPALNYFEPHVAVVNTGVEDILLEAVTLRYYYTKEGDSEEVATVLSSGAIPSNVITTFHQDYLEVGFAPDSGVLHPQNGNEGEVCLEVHKLDWSAYDQSDDWSFNPVKISYEDWGNITVYYNGELKWGSVPPPPTLEPTAEPTTGPTAEPTVEPTPTPVPVTALTCNITFPDNFGGTENHWIPNTGDKLDSLAIRFTATDSVSAIVPLTDTLATIVFLSPVDQNWDPEDPADPNNQNLRPNIHRNQGTCTYMLSAHSPGNTDYQDIARFHKTENAAGEDASFTTVWSGIGVNNGLRVDANGYLYYFDGANQYTRFAVSVYTPAGGTVRPGDDMKLRFALADDTNIIGKAGDGDFLAVYDFPLLWRAQSYLDEATAENGNATGLTDWNDANPWIDGNVWNLDYNALIANDPDYIRANHVNGGQINIKPWTRYDFDPNTQIHGSVAYSWGGCDSTKDFNDDLTDQRAAVRAWYTLHPIAGNAELTNTLQNWPNTWAPNNTWGIAEDNGQVNYRFGIPVAGSFTYDPIPGIEPRPYTPGFASKKYNRDVYEARHACYSAGADCSGFVQRAASYAGNRYDDNNGNVTDAGMNTLPEQRLLWALAYPAYMTNLLEADGLTAASWEIVNNGVGPINLVVPGDIVIISGVNVWHIGIVDRIQFGLNRQVTETDIRVIEAAGFGMKVRKDRAVEILGQIENVNLTTIRRLKYY
jgi:hypothetical protein